jgi:hypothetical protein
LKSEFKDWIATKSKNTPQRRKEISTYLGKVENEAKAVQNKINSNVTKGYVQCAE